MIGQIVNYRYEVLEKVGDGALFSVYKARDKVLNRLVALKLFSKDMAKNREFASAVCESYTSVSTLNHPNITRVIEADRLDDGCYIATEYARGTNVKERLRRAGPFAAPQALDVMIPVLEALDYAHSNRIVHGDIRPQDIVVSPDGEVKLTDFGLGKALQQTPEVADACAMRSAHYQAPEIAEGVAPNVRTDLYSVGVILYEMLTGVLPFEGQTPVAIALRKVKQPPTPPRTINAAVPTSLSDMILKAVDADPEKRYRSASEFLADLTSMREALRIGIPAVGPGQVIPTSRAVRKSSEAEGDSSSDLSKYFPWLVGAFAVTVLLVLALTIYFSGQEKQVRVPPLVGKTLEEAAYLAEESGFKLENTGMGYNDAYPEGVIYTQDPPSGTMINAETDVVKVRVSKGPSSVPVPDLTGMRQSQANAKAISEGFIIGKVAEEYSDRVPVNGIISQDPPPDVKRRPGTAIDVVVSLGPKPEPFSEIEPDTSVSESRTVPVSVQVPTNVDGPQEVRVVVNDERGERTVYEGTHSPGETIEADVSVRGIEPRIRVYVGGELVEDETY